MSLSNRVIPGNIENLNIKPDGNYIDDFGQIPMTLILENSEIIEVERNGQRVSVEMPKDALNKLILKYLGGILNGN